MRINEIFYSIQGEGFFAGTPAVFVRFAGCNLKCDFCDTNHQPFSYYTEDKIVRRIASYNANLVVFTGGEPSLQLTQSLVDKVKALGKIVAVETNGTKFLPGNIDWITLSPKDMFVGDKAEPVLCRVNEIKLIFDGIHPVKEYNNIFSHYYYLQPCDVGDKDKNESIINDCVNYIKEHPKWKISLQLQKILKVR